MVPRRTHTDPLFYNFRIPKFFDQIICNYVTFLFNTRSNNKIIIPQTNTNFFGTYSIKYQCINEWNHFSNIFKVHNLQLLSFSSVKKLVTNHILNSYNH